jgi:hypothetical protein
LQVAQRTHDCLTLRPCGNMLAFAVWLRFDPNQPSGRFPLPSPEAGAQ